MHEGSPSFGFRAPDPYLEQPKEVQDAGRLTSDLCEYEGEDGAHFFVRGSLEVPIHGISEPFLWGVWTSLSERSYRRYLETCDNPDSTDRFFGWLCNYLPYYPTTYALKTHVHPRIGRDRPFVVPEKATIRCRWTSMEGLLWQERRKLRRSLSTDSEQLNEAQCVCIAPTPTGDVSKAARRSVSVGAIGEFVTESFLPVKGRIKDFDRVAALFEAAHHLRPSIECR